MLSYLNALALVPAPPLLTTVAPFSIARRDLSRANLLRFASKDSENGVVCLPASSLIVLLPGFGATLGCHFALLIIGS